MLIWLLLQVLLRCPDIATAAAFGRLVSAAKLDLALAPCHQMEHLLSEV